LTLHDYAADVAAVIEALGVAPAHILGRTGGSRVARCLASDRPELVKSLILVTAGGLVPGDPRALAWVNAGPSSVPESQRLAVFQSFMLSPATTDPERVKRIYGFFPPAPTAGKAFMAANRATPVAKWWAGGGRVPMLVMQGLDDIIAPPANGRALRDEFPDRVKLVEIPNAGHALLFEQPERIAAEIMVFLTSLP
jgi:pimeloyl-ACP methyl ester carboxylesterase